MCHNFFFKHCLKVTTDLICFIQTPVANIGDFPNWVQDNVEMNKGSFSTRTSFDTVP